MQSWGGSYIWRTRSAKPAILVVAPACGVFCVRNGLIRRVEVLKTAIQRMDWVSMIGWIDDGTGSHGP